MPRKLKIIIWIISLHIMACEEEVDWEVKTVPERLVVDAFISNDSVYHKVSLSHSFDIYATRVKKVQNAIVFISDGINKFDFVESKNKAGEYVSSVAFRANPGISYELNIELEEAIGKQKHFSATSVMLKGIDIDSVDLPIFIKEDNGVIVSTYEVRFYGQETRGQGNIYEPIVTIDDSVARSKGFRSEHFFEDRLIENNYLQRTIFASNLFRENIEFEFHDVETRVIKYGRPVYDRMDITLYTYAPSYANYLATILDQINRKEDFIGLFGPAANVEGNISNGALGYFYSTYISRDSIAYRSEKEKIIVKL